MDRIQAGPDHQPNGLIDDNSSAGSSGYRMSKVALSRGIAVAILHPGLMRTSMVAFNPQGSPPQQAVEGLLARINALGFATSGAFWQANGEGLPW